MSKSTKGKQFTIYVKDQDIKRVKELAKEQCTNMSEIVRRGLIALEIVYEDDKLFGKLAKRMGS
jgi:hypothetical protein